MPAFIGNVTVAVLHPFAPEFVQVVVFGARNCHWYVSPAPVALIVNTAFAPTVTLVAAGCVVIFVFAVSLAVFETVLFPLASVITHRYRYPFMPAFIGNVIVAVLHPSAPEFVQVVEFGA